MFVWAGCVSRVSVRVGSARACNCVVGVAVDVAVGALVDVGASVDVADGGAIVGAFVRGPGDQGQRPGRVEVRAEGRVREDGWQDPGAAEEVSHA